MTETERLVAQMRGEMKRRQFSRAYLEARSGVSGATVRGWGRYRSPRLDLFVTTLEALGLKMVIVRRGPDE